MKITAGFKSTKFKEFNQWFKKEEFNLGCHYCGTNEESLRLYNMQLAVVKPDETLGFHWMLDPQSLQGYYTKIMIVKVLK